MKHFTVPEDGGLITKNLPKDILHGYDKIFTEVYADSTEGSHVLAKELIDEIKAFTAANPGKLYRLGLTTGSTPVSLYKILSSAFRKGEVSFKQVEVFSIDEYYPSAPEERQSRNFKLHQELLDNVDILPENVHIPDGTVPHDKVGQYCLEFDAKARNLDMLIIGIGEQGQVGFNEAGAASVRPATSITTPRLLQRRPSPWALELCFRQRRSCSWPGARIRRR